MENVSALAFISGATNDFWFKLQSCFMFIHAVISKKLRISDKNGQLTFMMQTSILGAPGLDAFAKHARISTPNARVLLINLINNWKNSTTCFLVDSNSLEMHVAVSLMTGTFIAVFRYSICDMFLKIEFTRDSTFGKTNLFSYDVLGEVKTKFIILFTFLPFRLASVFAIVLFSHTCWNELQNLLKPQNSAQHRTAQLQPKIFFFFHYYICCLMFTNDG